MIHKPKDSIVKDGIAGVTPNFAFWKSLLQPFHLALKVFLPQSHGSRSSLHEPALTLSRRDKPPHAHIQFGSSVS